MKSISLACPITLLVTLLGNAQEPGLSPDLKKALSVITEARVLETLSYLADDARKGRDTPSKELDQAADWLAERFATMKLRPAFGESFFQGETASDVANAKVTLTIGEKIVTLAPECILAAGRGQKRLDHVPLLTWTLGWARTDPARAKWAKDAAIVLDARGLDGPAVASRLRALSRENPAAVLLLKPEPDLPVRTSKIPVLGLFEESLVAAIPVANEPWKGTRLSVEIPESKSFFARNVGAFLEGSDPKAARDLLIVSAHYDHVGIGRPVDGDAVYNGADDNASGTTAVQMIALALKSLPVAPKRSVLFLCFYGEEKGFQGSRYYCENPAFPLSRTRAVFNIEMVGRPEDIKPNEAWVTGWRLSNFGPLIAASGESAGIKFFEHGRFSRMLFAQSDNIEFAKRGVVAHSISAGSLHRDYHRPSDEVKKIDVPNMTRVIRGLALAVARMADGDAMPAWLPGSSYAEAAERSQGGR